MVLTWNETELAERCVRSVLASNYECLNVVVVDNGSEPPACPILQEQFPTIETVQLSENTGFAAGCNRGIERGIDLGADYIFILNNDSIVPEDTIGHLVEAMETHEDSAIACPLLLYGEGEKRASFYKGEVDRDTAFHFHPGEGELVTEENRVDFDGNNFAPACAILVRSETLRQIGMFDESLFTNWEDYDLCIRIRDAGWKILTVGKAEVIHSGGETTGTISPFITYYGTRNRLVCLFRYGRLLRILRNSLWIVRSFYWQIRGYGFSNWPAHRAFLKGVFHFLIGVRGKGGAPSERRDRKP